METSETTAYGVQIRKKVETITMLSYSFRKIKKKDVSSWERYYYSSSYFNCNCQLDWTHSEGSWLQNWNSWQYRCWQRFVFTFKTLISIFLVFRERGWIAGGSKNREDSKQQPVFLVPVDVILFVVTVRADGVLSFKSDTRIRILL